MINRRQFLVATSLGAGISLAHAETYPSRPIRVVFPFAAGGSADGLLRYVAQQMGHLLGQQMVVDNRSGAAGSIGVLHVAGSSPDGYTLLYTTVPGVVQTPLVAKTSGFDPVRGIRALGLVATAPLAMYAHSSVPATDFLGLTDWVRKQDKEVHVSGAGPIIEVACARLNKELGLKLRYVPYRGGLAALQAVLTGDVPLFFSVPSGPAYEHIKTGTLKAIVVTSARSSPLFPGVAPLSSYPKGFVQTIGYGLWGPPDIPSEIAGKLSAVLRQVLAEPGMAGRFHAGGLELTPGGADDLSKATAMEAENIRLVLQTTDVKFGG